MILCKQVLWFRKQCILEKKSSQIVPTTAELGLDVPELDELIDESALLISVLTDGKESFAIL